MTSFIPKTLPHETSLGEKLRQVRLQKNQRIEDLSRSLGIRREYLEAIEESQYDRLPSGLYGKSFLKKYALRLGFKLKDISHDLDRISAENELGNPFSQKIVKKHKFLIFPRLIRNIIFGVAITACLLYLVLYSKKIILPPELIITQPENNALLKENSYLIKGQTDAGAEVRINEALVLNNDQGNFAQMVNLKKGINTLTISAKKRYSRPRVEIRQILVE